jgi:hypothetical protein
MPLANDLVTEIARSVAAEQGPDLDVLGILSSGGSERIELLVGMPGDDDEPRRYMITVPRTDASEFESQLRTKLSKVVRDHG